MPGGAGAPVACEGTSSGLGQPIVAVRKAWSWLPNTQGTAAGKNPAQNGVNKNTQVS